GVRRAAARLPAGAGLRSSRTGFARGQQRRGRAGDGRHDRRPARLRGELQGRAVRRAHGRDRKWAAALAVSVPARAAGARSEEHTSELQSRENLVCRLLLEKKKKKNIL